MNSNKEHWILCPACGSKMRARLLPDTVSVGSFNSVLKNSGYILMFSSRRSPYQMFFAVILHKAFTDRRKSIRHFHIEEKAKSHKSACSDWKGMSP